MKPSGWRGYWSRVDPEEVRISELERLLGGGVQLRVKNGFGIEDISGKASCGGGFGIDS